MTADENTHDKGRELAEEALEHYAKGDQVGGDKLAEKAVKTDREGAEEVVRDLDEDAKATSKND